MRIFNMTRWRFIRFYHWICATTMFQMVSQFATKKRSIAKGATFILQIFQQELILFSLIVIKKTTFRLLNLLHSLIINLIMKQISEIQKAYWFKARSQTKQSIRYEVEFICLYLFCYMIYIKHISILILISIQF